MISLALAALALSSADLRAATGIDPAMCRLVEIDASGNRTERAPTAPYRRPDGLSARAESSGAGSSHSSVSVSSASASGTASGSSSVTLAGRTITTTYDNAGCAIVVDARAAQGAHP